MQPLPHAVAASATCGCRYDQSLLPPLLKAIDALVPPGSLATVLLCMLHRPRTLGAGWLRDFWRATLPSYHPTTPRQLAARLLALTPTHTLTLTPALALTPNPDPNPLTRRDVLARGFKLRRLPLPQPSPRGACLLDEP